MKLELPITLPNNEESKAIVAAIPRELFVVDNGRASAEVRPHIEERGKEIAITGYDVKVRSDAGSMHADIDVTTYETRALALDAVAQLQLDVAALRPRCGLNADWATEAWAFGADIFILDAEETNSHGHQLYVLVRVAGEDADGNTMIETIEENTNVELLIMRAHLINDLRAAAAGRCWGAPVSIEELCAAAADVLAKPAGGAS